MATQQTGTPAKKRRMGIFPDSVRKIVIVFMIVLFVIAGIIGSIGILRGWDIVFNILFMIFAVAGVILAILAFWPSNNQNEASAPLSHKSSRRFKWKSEITWGQEDITETTSESQLIKVNNNQPAEQSAVLNASAINPHQPPKDVLINLASEQAETGEITQYDKYGLLEKLSPLANPNDIIQASPLQENQLTFNPPDPQQSIPQNMSSRELLSLAQAHIQSAQQSITAAAQPFGGKGSLFSRHFKNAITLLGTTIEHIRHLLILLPEILLCPPEPKLAALFRNHEEIKVEVYRAIDEVEKYIALLQKKDKRDRQDIDQRGVKLINMLKTLNSSFGGGDNLRL